MINYRDEGMVQWVKWLSLIWIPSKKENNGLRTLYSNHMAVTWGRKQVDPRGLLATNQDKSVSFSVDEKTFQINEVESDRENHPSSAYDLHMHLHR